MAPQSNSEFEFRFIVQESSDGMLEAYCIDSGAVGVGNTVLAAINDMVSALEEMYQATLGGEGTMFAEPTKSDLVLYSDILVGAKRVPAHIKGAGAIVRVEKKQRGRKVHVGFDATNLHMRRAA